MLIGEPYWRRDPPDQATVEGCAGIGSQGWLPLPELIESFGLLGCDVVEMVLADQDSWDRYVAAQWLSIRRWLEANAKAIIYMQGHEDWTIGFLKHYFEEQDDHVVKLVFDNFIKRINPDGVMKPEWMQASLELAASAGMETKLTADQIFSTAFTPIKP